MNICFVYKEDYPWDVRVEKIVKSLIKKGHSLFLVARNNDRKDTSEVYHRINMRRLPFLPRCFGKINNAIGFPLFFNPLWIYYIFRCVRKEKCDVLIIRDLPLMLTGIVIGKLLKKRVYFDMAECYPNMYGSILKFGGRKLFNIFFKNPFIASIIEYISVRWSDHIFVMIEESRDRLLKKGIEENKISIVRNTPEIIRVNKYKKYDENKDPLKLLYVGNVTYLRGIDNVIWGLWDYYSHDKIEKEFEFNVIGIGTAYTDLMKLTKTLNLERYVHFHGWCSQTKVDRYLSESDIGILPYRYCSHWNTTIPNKLFDYMAAGLPVIATQIKPIKRIVEDSQCGMLFEDNDYEGFTLAIHNLLNGNMQKMAENGMKAIKEEYNWENDFIKILNIIVSK